jgi:hypothetical protein
MAGKIIICRGVCKEELGAFILAEKVANRLRERKNDVFLKTIPLNETWMGWYHRVKRNEFGPDNSISEEFNRIIEAKDRYKGLSGTIFEFHNYDTLGFEMQPLGWDRMWKARYPVLFSLEEGENRKFVMEMPAVYKNILNPFYSTYRRHRIVNLNASGESGFISDPLALKLARGIERLESSTHEELIERYHFTEASVERQLKGAERDVGEKG